MIRVGVIGTGLMGEVHARNVQRCPGAQLVALADADDHRVNRLAAQLGVRPYIDGLAVIGADFVDAVIVASPDSTHADYTMACLNAGKPVLCEKPLASNVEDAYRVVEAEAETGRRLVQTGFMREFDPAHVAVREAVASRDLGNVVMVRGTHVNPFPAGPTDATRLITQSLIHDFHSVRFLTGQEIVLVFARSVPRRDDGFLSRLVTVSCVLSDGAVGLLDVNAESSYGYEVSAEVVCEVGTVRTGLTSPVVVSRTGWAGAKVAPNWQTQFAEAYRIEMEAWIGSLKSNRHSYAVPGSRFRILPANPSGTVYSKCSRRRYTCSPPIRSNGSASRHSVSPTFRNRTVITAFRFASPLIAHSKPRLCSVGCSTTNRPVCVLSSGATALKATHRPQRKQFHMGSRSCEAEETVQQQFCADR